MKIDDIKNLNYNGFKRNKKAIEKCINNYFKNTEITYNYEETFEKINFILWGCTDIELLENQNKYIAGPYNVFYVNRYEPYFILKVDGVIEFTVDGIEQLKNIKVKIKRKHHFIQIGSRKIWLFN